MSLKYAVIFEQAENRLLFDGRAPIFARYARAALQHWRRPSRPKANLSSQEEAVTRKPKQSVETSLRTPEVDGEMRG